MLRAGVERRGRGESSGPCIPEVSRFKIRVRSAFVRLLGKRPGRGGKMIKDREVSEGEISVMLIDYLGD